MRILFVLLSCSVGMLVHGQSILGKWVTVDDETGERKSVVEITERNGKVYGRIVQLFRKPDQEQDPSCTKCDPKDDRYNKKVRGMEIIRDMARDDDEWEDGTIMDPKTGTVYDCKMWLEDGDLKVRAYVAFLYRTQTWERQ
jgi:uncharacterized protein (DUF2147 family)